MENVSKSWSTLSTALVLSLTIMMLMNQMLLPLLYIMAWYSLFLALTLFFSFHFHYNFFLIFSVVVFLRQLFLFIFLMMLVCVRENENKKRNFPTFTFCWLIFCCCCYCCFCFCTQLIKTLLGLVMVVALVSSCLNECGPYDDVGWVWVNENCKWTEKNNNLPH